MFKKVSLVRFEGSPIFSGANKTGLLALEQWRTEPDVMRGLQPAGATRVTLDVINPSPTSLTPEKWKETATLCPLDWPSNTAYCSSGT